MGGSKNKSPAQKEKSQAAKKPDSKKSRRGDKGGDGSPSSPSVEVRVVVTEAQAAKALASSRTVTAHNMARQMGVKISAAHAYLRGAVERGQVEVVGGKSGHRVYAVVGSKIPARAPGMASTLGTTSSSSKGK